MHGSRRAALCIMAILVAAAPAASPAGACSTFCFKDRSRILFGKNYDWHVAEGLLIVNKRGVAKRADGTGTSEPAAWTSKHGSVTFNQYGREFPSGGMNEAGLVVELMWLDGTRYPAADSRGALGALQWIQYQLDTAGSVTEVLASDARIRIESSTPLHYLIADRAGRVAAVEFLDGRLVSHGGDPLPVPVLTNDRYDRSLEFVERLRTEGRPAPEGYGSLHRFARAAERAAGFGGVPGAGAVDYAFETLADLAQGDATKWSIVYELDERRVSFKTALDGAVRTLSLSGLDFGCESLALAIDVNAGPAGDVRSRLRPCTDEMNLNLVRTAYRKTRFLSETPDAIVRAQASYPETTLCVREGEPGGVTSDPGGR